MKRMTCLWIVITILGLVLPMTVSAEMFRIGEAQIVSHPALDNDSKGFKVALEEEGFIELENKIIDRQNAQGEQPN